MEKSTLKKIYHSIFISTIGKFFPVAESVNSFSDFMYIVLTNTGNVLSCITGAGIGVGIALALKFDTLKTIVLAAAGEIAAYFSLSTKFVGTWENTWGKFQIGDPLTIYLVVIATALLMKLVLRKKTPVDILLIPLF